MTRTIFLLSLATVVVIAGCSDSSDAPFPPLLDRYVLASDDSVPEGIAFDPVERAFYATSLQGASIVRVAADGAESTFRAADGRARIGGAKVDAEARRLWVCATQVDGLDNRVWVFDLQTGELALEFPLGALTTGGSCNDLVLDQSGAAYVTDPANPFIYRLDPATGQGEVLASDPLFADVTGAGLGLNGIAISPTGDALVVAKFFPAGLLRVSLPAGGDIAQISLAGDTLPSPDGLMVLEGDVYAVSDSAVSRVRSSDGFASATVTVAPQVSGLSTGTVAEGELYAIKSEVTRFVVGQPLMLPFEILRIDRAVFDQ